MDPSPSERIGKAFHRLLRATAGEKGSGAVPPGHVLAGRYELLRIMGEGGMGAVYEAVDLRLKRTVAIKLLHAPWRPDLLRRFQQEAVALARLHHPGIVQIYDAGEEEGIPFLVMERMEGSPLDEALHQRMIDRRGAVRILGEAAEGVAAAHTEGILHRDIKPANIFVTRAKRGLVMDFGLAKLADAIPGSQATGSALLGTPSYMSPEQATGRATDRRTDVWGLGTTLYHVLTGLPPFEGRTISKILDRIAREEPRPPRKINPDIDRDLEIVCLHALEKDPGRRYPGVEDFARDLKLWLEGRPILARPPSLTYRLGKWIRRRRIWIAVGAAGLLLSGVALGAGFSYLREREFHGKKARARETYRAGKLKEARSLAQEGLRLRDDKELRDILEATGRRWDENERRRALAARIAHIEKEIARAGEAYYDKDTPIRSVLDPFEGTLKRFAEEVASPRYASFAEGWRTLGIGWYVAGDASRAEKALQKAVERDATDLDTNFYLGRVLLDRLAAAQWSISGTGHHHGHPHGKMRREHVTKRILPLLTRATAAWKKKGDFFGRLIQAYWATTISGKEVESLCAQAFEKYRRRRGAEEFLYLQGIGSEKGAEKRSLFTQAIRIRPHYSRAYVVRGLLSLNTGDFERAFDDIERALSIHPRLAVGLHTRAVLWHTLKQRYDNFRRASMSPRLASRLLPTEDRLRKALRDAGAAIRLQPDFWPALAIRGLLLGEFGRTDDAVSDMRKARALAPHSPLVPNLLGDLLVNQRRWDEALRELEASIALCPTYPDPVLNKARLFFSRGQYGEALAQVQAALRLSPNDANTYYWLGATWMRMGDHLRAREAFTRCLERNPRHKDSYRERAGCLIVLRRYKEALADLRKALKIAPKDPQLYVYRGACLANGFRKYKEAIQDFKTALRLAPRDWDLRRETEENLKRVEEQIRKK